MADALLSASLAVLFDRLASRELLNLACREGLQKKLDNWRKTLLVIQKVLDDAEEKQDNGVAVKKWLDDLRDLAYDVEDTMDEFATEALQQKPTEGNQDSTSKVWNLIPPNFTPSAVMTRSRLRSEIDEITARFNAMVKQKDDMKLSENVDRRSYRTRKTLAPTSVVTEDHVYGREKDKNAVLHFLLDEHCSHAKLSVIPILGMGGIGKTTLVQLVYHDENVDRFFDLKAWACVSEDFDAVKVTKTVLKSVTSESCDDNELDLLQVKLKAKLKGKKFLVVLDDLWNEKYHDWTIFCAPFKVGAPGSTIIVTTRNEGVALKTSTITAYTVKGSSNDAAEIPESTTIITIRNEPVKTGTIPTYTYTLKGLSNDDCLPILAHHALGRGDFGAHSNLKDIGEKIVNRRCKGSPLAAKVLGGVLRNKVDRYAWEDVLNSEIWDIAEVKNEIVPALMLSYHHLPPHLKRCFAYCSILPKDYIFKKKQLVLLWMAEGLLLSREGRKQMEALGSDYFLDLLARSFFQQSFEDESRFVMHDLINDLAQQVAGDVCFKMDDRDGGNNGTKPSIKPRHSSYLRREYDGIQKFEDFYDLTCLRTFLPLTLPYPSWCYLASNVPLKLFPKLRRLRVLSLSGYRISELPESIGDLKHLRLLDLSYTEIRSLPESVATLYNLQSLILESCSHLKQLPSKFGNLVNLRHLNILNITTLEGMPPQIGKLTSLQSLSNLVVGKGSCSGIKELGPLLHLQETLCISRLENVINPEDARNAKLIEKHKLYGLSLEWSKNSNQLQGRTSELGVLNMLQPHEGLQELTVKHYGCAEFPIWLKVPSFSNMVFLKIESCAKCKLLPAVGQLSSLRDLFIIGMASVKEIGHEFYGNGCSEPFISLETLYFEEMQNWENWIPYKEFPKLRKLSITKCPKLLGNLPNLSSLENIVIHECRQLVSIPSLPINCKLEIEGSVGVVRESKVHFSSLCLLSLPTILQFTCQIEGFTMEGLARVKKLTIERCEELTTLWSIDVGLLEHLTCLGVLEINHCSKLVSLVAIEVEQLQLANTIGHCEVLESLPKSLMYTNMYLEEINIGDCNSLTHFAKGQLPPTLKRLRISMCKNMQILVDGNGSNSWGSCTSLLEYLDISDCPSLESLMPSGELPATLQHLKIRCCEKLESIAQHFHHNLFLEVIEISSCKNLTSLPMGIHSLSHLDQLSIQECPILDSFPDGGRSLPANLKKLAIFKCENMQALPNCIHNLTSLQHLKVQGCPGIVGFPTNLTILSIHDMVSFNTDLFEQELHRLTSLKQLEFDGSSSPLVSFPKMMLPASLTSLKIKSFPNLKYLASEGFQFLASLEQLWIAGCKKLLRFPNDGLPPSLLELQTKACPLLEARCQKDQGEEWYKIAHISFVAFNQEFI